MGLRTAKFYRKDMWKANLALYDTVVIFGTESLVSSLSICSFRLFLLLIADVFVGAKALQ